MEERENMGIIGSGVGEQCQRRGCCRNLSLARCPCSRALPPAAILHKTQLFTASLAGVALGGPSELTRGEQTQRCVAQLPPLHSVWNLGALWDTQRCLLAWPHISAAAWPNLCSSCLCCAPHTTGTRNFG